MKNYILALTILPTPVAPLRYNIYFQLVSLTVFLARLVFSNASGGFFYYVTNPYQPITLLRAYTFLRPYDITPIIPNTFPPIPHNIERLFQARPHLYLNSCTNNVGLHVPCYIGGASGMTPDTNTNPEESDTEGISNLSTEYTVDLF